jgi:dTDP-glucose 4,6-dehydratase
MKKTALITGIGGSIGCHVMVHLLHNTDWDIVGIDSFRHKGLMDRVHVMLDGHPEYYARMRMHTHDLRAPLSQILMDRIGKIDYILNLAALPDVFDSIENPVPFVISNTQMVLNVLEFARYTRPDAFLHVSTDEVYGPTDGKTFHKEWDPILPSNPYSASKVAQEAIAISYWRAYNLPLIIVNLMNNFGEMQAPDKFPSIIQRKLARGEKITIHGSPDAIGTRFYIHSRNSADAFLFLLKNIEPHLHIDGSMDKPDRYNIVGDRQVGNEELVNFIAGVLGVKAHYEFEDFKVTRPGHDRHYGLDGAKLFSLGWKSPVSFEDSMRNTVNWVRDHPEWLEPK